MEGLRAEGLMDRPTAATAPREVEEADAANEETFGAGAEPVGPAALPRFFQQSGGDAEPYDLQSWLASDGTLGARQGSRCKGAQCG
eukprot:scaffold6180_cov200-Pinguiococcus_pyrenoidosus.AAC.9